MSASYCKIITDCIESGDMKKAYKLFCDFEAEGQFTAEEVESLEKKFDDPSLPISQQYITHVTNAIAKVLKRDRTEVRKDLQKLDEKSWRRLRIDLNVDFFSD